MIRERVIHSADDACEVLRTLINGCGIRISDVMAKAGISQYYINNLDHGKTRKRGPSTGIMAGLLEALGYELVIRRKGEGK